MSRLLISLVLLGATGVHAAELMTPQQFQAIPVPAGGQRIAYGADANQFGELRVPSGAGPHPVVVMIHGGCFRAEYAKLDELAQMGEALRAEGVATWNVEYRRLGQAGGGWPGTYLDVGRGIDHLRTLAAANRLDLGRVVIVGHSAGGHLAHWSASRARLRAGSPIALPNPLVPRGVVNLAGLPDLRENTLAYERDCGAPVLHQMLGGGASLSTANAADAAAVERLPLRVKQRLVVGEHENFVPRPVAADYVARARAAGDDAAMVLIPGAGHFEIAATTTPAWSVVKSSILQLLQP